MGWAVGGHDAWVGPLEGLEREKSCLACVVEDASGSRYCISSDTEFTK